MEKKTLSKINTIEKTIFSSFPVLNDLKI
jgi:hypothetical protein